MMAAWTRAELEKVGAAEELELTPRLSDGGFGDPVTIWVVPGGEDLYVRSWRGSDGAWYRRARQSGEAHISAGGVERDVRVVRPPEEVNDDVDSAYQSKYGRHAASYVEPMVRPEARATTLKLVPASTQGDE
jgi:hypothetical protein